MSINSACIDARNILQREMTRFEQLCGLIEDDERELTSDEQLEYDILGMVFCDLRRLVERFDKATGVAS